MIVKTNSINGNGSFLPASFANVSKNPSPQCVNDTVIVQCYLYLVLLIYPTHTVADFDFETMNFPRNFLGDLYDRKKVGIVKLAFFENCLIFSRVYWISSEICTEN